MSSFVPVQPQEVERLIQKLSLKTSPLDIVPVQLLKQCQTELSVIIAHLANASFSTGLFPRSMKFAIVTPLLKKAGLDTSVMKNFRPVSNLSTVSKLLERLAVVRLKPHICSSSNWNNLQSAYSQGHSTETALCKILDDIIEAADGGHITALFSLDISGAFDAVDHQILIQRLEEEFGITDTCRNWIKSYLTGRSATVRIGTATSPTVDVPLGVPQGSVLGPLLYTVYVAPIGRLIHNLGVNYHQYADDTQLYTKLEVPVSASLATLQQCVTALHAWFSQNGLLLNPDKSEVMYIGTRQRLRISELPETVTVAGSTIATTDKLKVLGVIINI